MMVETQNNGQTHTFVRQSEREKQRWGISHALKLGLINKGDNIVCVQGWRGGMGHTNTVRVVPAEENLGLAEE